MIVKTILYDLVGAKIWSSVSFTRESFDDDLIQRIVESYFSSVQDGTFSEGMTTIIDDQGICVHTMYENILLLGISHSPTVTPHDIERFSRLRIAFNAVVENKGARVASKSFETFAGQMLRQDIVLFFISTPSPSDMNHTSTAIERLLGYTKTRGTSLSLPVEIGPYNVRIARIPIKDAVENRFEQLGDADAVVLVLGTPLPNEIEIHGIVENLRNKGASSILIAPGSDEELEIARSYEVQLDLVLCDSVSLKPSYLLLSVLAMIGRIDVHPELAAQSWMYESEMDRYTGRKSVVTNEETLGHQAFFVVNKFTGEAIFTYYYESKAQVHERVPNVVAAITSFSLGSQEGAKTTVVQVGNFVYALIEHENLIFTLITGQKDDVEGIRSQFSFLPDLWKDEALTDLEITDDPYTSPPFTLKLLATLPPEELLGRMIPTRKTEPSWSRFKSAQVRDFLQAVWGSLDGSIRMSQLVVGSGPQMTLGAIHFLKSMGCIDMKLFVNDNDIPIVSGIIDSDLLKLYSHLMDIASAMNGERTLTEISKKTGIDKNVLITVITSLYQRGIITFK
ncbi:MAG: hypothetical protein ACFFF4_08105 [Candidatus Thorarchaeota archaeon]